MRLSIVIPALNEAASIATTLMALQPLRERGVEVIVVDSGSSDETRAIAAPRVDRVIDSARGRARQMNAGAAAASGDTLLFLHADSVLPAGAEIAIAGALADPRYKWGRFDVAITGAHFMFPVIAWCMNRRSRWTGIATGDQGIFADREAFTRVGGFPDQPLMEDIEICRRLKGIGPPACLRAVITTSGRRWEKYGLWRTILLMWRLRFNYFCGDTPESIHRAYTKQ